MICSAALLGLAQAANAQEESTEVQELVVTGSRIPQPNLTSVSPVTAVTNETIKVEGTTRVEDLLNALPQAFAGMGSEVSNGASGIATVNLRGLGAVRTLVLIDGRRVVPGDPSSPLTDLNFIPASLVDRIDVVTGGASAVYGADAVAGVVNFIMMKNFEGVRLEAQVSGYHHKNDNDTIQGLVRGRNYALPNENVWDGAGIDLTAMIGVNSPDGRGNATVYATYRHTDPITQDKRDYSACSLNNSDAAPAGYLCGGSGTTAPTHIQSNDLFNAGLPFDLIVGGNGFRPYNSATDAFNFAPYNFYQRVDERFTFGAFAHYEINKAADVYTQLMFMDDRTRSVVAPSGVFGQTIAVPCSSPLLSPNQIATICTAAGLGPDDAASLVTYRRNIEGGGREDDLRHTDYRMVWGIRGDLGKGWNYDVYGQYSTVVFSEVFRNDLSVARVSAALDVVRDPTTGQPVCRNSLNPNTPVTLAGCVPYDIFGPTGPSAAALAYVSVPGFSNGQTNEQVLSAQLTGDLGQYGIKSPMANDGVGIALGAEYRRESSEFFNDLEFSTGDLAGQGGPQVDVSGAFDVMEIFGELRIPIVQDVTFFKDLSFEGGYRYSDYSLAGTTSTYKLALNWAPVEDIRLRAGYNRAVRAPNIVELFTPQAIGNGLADDPCSGPTPVFTQAQCANTGVSASQYGRVPQNTANQYSALFGGNPNLSPETADSYTVGFVLTPTFLSGFSLSVDYFDIKVKDTISALNPSLILTNCAITADPTLCGLVRRAPTNGSLFTGGGNVEATNVNIGYLKTSGVDFEANYRLPLANWGMEGIGGIALAFTGTWLDKLETDPGLAALGDNSEVLATSFDCAGLYGPNFCGTPNPEWRHRLRVTWTTPVDGLSLSVNWRYFGAVQSENAGSDNPYFDLTPIYNVDKKIPAQNYFDATVTWRVKENYTLRVGVNNLFDRDPPIIGSQSGGASAFFNGNTFPVVYDALGRFLFMGITADF
jgi:iron complex outermembrane recepter protein